MGGGEVIKRGWLVKSPPLEGGGIKAWRKRFFMLRSSKVLEYYKSPDGDVLKGVINLEDCKTVHSDLSHKKYKYVFDIETKDRVYYLVAQSQEEMKAWVDQLCRICGLSVMDETEFLPTPATDVAVLTPPPPTGGTAGPSITSPIYATPPNRNSGVTGGGVPFSERFRPSSEPPIMESMYSLAQSAETEVHRQLSGDQEVAAGTPLAEALAYKGISTRTSSISSASGGEANTSMGTDSPSSFLSPRHEPAQDMQNLYSPVPKKTNGGGETVGVASKPVPKPRSATSLNPFTPRSVDAADHRFTASMSEPLTAGGLVPNAAARGERAETLANGYMQPRQVKRVGNYDQLPLGPPRPAVGLAPGGHSPKQHRSALLKPEPMSRADQGGPPQVEAPTGKQNSTYINVQHMANELPPVIDRKNKPPMPSPPRIDRNLKPKEGETSGSDSSLHLTESPLHAAPPTQDSPPMFPTRTTSLNPHSENPHSENQPHLGQPSQSGGEGPPPEFPMRTTSLANTLEASGSHHVEDEFTEGDLPTTTKRTMQYTQVSFDENTQRPAISELGLFPGGIDLRRAPVPAPRGSGIGRVNYSDVDLAATSALSGRGLTREVTLREAERMALKDKQYVNVRKEGDVDEDTDPGYYTHMRNLTYEEALEIYNMPVKSIDLDDDEEDEVR